MFQSVYLSSTFRFCWRHSCVKVTRPLSLRRGGAADASDGGGDGDLTRGHCGCLATADNHHRRVR
jgi:hypothetical protein